MKTFKEHAVLMTEMAKQAATHYGECQLCGHRQKLPGNKMAKHGYTKQWGFFSGTCPGSDNACFEHDKTLAVASLTRIKKIAKGIRDKAEQERAARDKVWHQHFIPASWENKHSHYEWRQHPVSAVQTDAHGKTNLHFVDEKGRPGEDQYSGPSRYKGKDEYIASKNAAYADHLHRYADQHEHYIKWQKKRTDEWQKKDLVPIAGRGAEGAATVPEKKTVKAGSVVMIHGKQRTIKEVKDKTAWGIGPGMNGKVMPHAMFTGSDGKEYGHPVRLIRQQHIIKE